MNGELVAARLAAGSTRSTEDLATAVAVLRDVVATDPQSGTRTTSTTTQKGTL
jgi:hypothetical protein